MKKPFCYLLLSLSLLLLLIVLLFPAVVKKSLSPAATGLLVTDLYAIRDRYVNMYLIRSGEEYVAIDAGISEERVRREMHRLGIDPGMVKAVLLTHSDPDHTGGLSLFTGADIYLPAAEEQMINGETRRMPWSRNFLPVTGYQLIGDTVFMVAGMTVRPVPAPGHTPGMTCYQVNGQWLFTGDAIALRRGAVAPFPRFLNMDDTRARESIGNVIAVEGAEHLFTGHHGHSDDYRAATVARCRTNLRSCCYPVKEQ